MSSPIDLTTVAKVTTYGDLSANVAGALGPLVTSASQSFMTLTERSDYINGQFVNEVRIGTGTVTLVTEHFPIISIAGPLKVAGQTIPAVLDAGVANPRGYYVDLKRGYIQLVGYRFWRGANVVIPYFYGYATVPLDVEQAVNEMVLFIFRKRTHIDMVTQTLSMQVTRYLDDFPKSTRDIISYYKRKRRTDSFSIGTGSAPILPTGLQQESFVASGLSNVFTLSRAPVGGVAWFRNGSIQLLGSDYTISGPTITQIAPTPASALTGDNFTAIYA